MCEPKNRVLSRNQKYVTLGLHAYQRFWQMRQNPKHVPQWDDFEKSSLYLAFIRFGKHVSNIKAINPLGFVDFLLRADVGVDQWCNEYYYHAYVRELNKLETPIEALKRSFVLMEYWAIQEQADWRDFFRKIAPSQAVLWIKSGRISPWILLTATSVADLFERLDSGQMAIVEENIDEKFWEIKMDMHKSAVEEIKKILKESGI
ncbi:unnamed protein product [Sphagnum tenellum]